jgi:site-specific recombinase
VTNRPPDLGQLLDSLDPAAPRAQRHLWLIALLAWVRAGLSGADPGGAVARVRLLLDAIAQRPEWQVRWQAWWQGFSETVDLAPLLADYGFAPRTAFLSALGEQLRRRLIPGTPDTDDLIALFDLLLPDARDALWLRALDADTAQRLHTLLFGSAHTGDTTRAALLDALAYSVGQVVATGFAAEIRVRMGADARADRPFQALSGALERLRQAVLNEGRTSPAAAAAAQELRARLDTCRQAAATVYSHLDEHGISVGIVFRLRQLRERVLRIRQLLDALLAPQPLPAAAQLLAQLVLVGQAQRGIRDLIAGSAQLTAAKVAERSAESGEHYITRDAAGYRAMLASAAGGGAVLAFTTWGKFALYALALPAFWSGLAAGLNYAVSFIVVMLLHWTVATKQPAVTAPAMAARLRDMGAPDAAERFVDEVVHLLRSQFAAIAGNLGLVVPVVLLLNALLVAVARAPMIDAEHARQVLHDQSLLGPTALFAAFTGVLLFASSIVAGWVENAFVLHRIDSAMTWNPRFTATLGAHRAATWAAWLRANISGLAANLSLGLMLGLVPAVSGFFGIGLEVRHVTLSSGQVAAAAFTLGPAVLAEASFWWAVAGLVVIGALNLAVSFYLAFRLALAARNITGVDRRNLAAALRRRWRTAPGSFLRPPPARSSAPGSDHHG